MEFDLPSEPKTLVKAIRHFADPDVCLLTMVNLRWTNGVRCSTCGQGGGGAEAGAEADETFIGALARNMRKTRRKNKITDTGGSGKEVVMGILHRGTEVRNSKVKAKRIADTTSESIHPEVKAAVAISSGMSLR